MSVPERRGATAGPTPRRRQKEFVLEDWHLLPDGRFRGVLDNSLAVEFDGDIVGSTDPGVVIGPGGSRYLLGHMAPKVAEDGHDRKIRSLGIPAIASVLAGVLAASLACAWPNQMSHGDNTGTHAACSREQLTKSGEYELSVQGETLEVTTTRTQLIVTREVCARSAEDFERAPILWVPSFISQRRVVPQNLVTSLDVQEGLESPSGATVVMVNAAAFVSTGLMLTTMYRVFVHVLFPSNV